MSGYDQERIGELLRTLPSAPVAWLRAAQELPLALRDLDEIVRRAEADAAFRARLTQDLEAALAGDGFAAEPVLLDALRSRLDLV